MAMLDLLREPAWQSIGVLAILLMVALELYAHRRHNEKTK